MTNTFIEYFDGGIEPKLENLGGKGASLVTMTETGMPVPPGFVITTSAFDAFVHAELTEQVNELLEGLDTDDVDAVDEVSAKIRQLILDCPVPEEVREATRTAYEKLQSQFDQQVPVAGAPRPPPKTYPRHLAETLGLEIENGLVVDAHALASDGTTVVAGDVANMPNPVPGSPADERIRLESVNNAIEHAKVAAYSLMGCSEEYAGIPWFWSNQGDIKLQIAGLSNGYDQTVVRHDTERGKFSVLYYRNGQIIAADCASSPLDFMAVIQALSKGKNIDAETATDVSTMLKKLIA